MTENDQKIATILRLPCGCHVVWDDRLGPVAPCRDCDPAGWRAWAVGCGLVTAMAERSGE